MKQARLWVKDSIRARQDDLAETWEKPSRTWPMPVLPRRAEPMQHGRLRIVLCRPSGVDGGHMVVDGENITGLERGRPAEPPPFPKPEIHYSKYAGNPFFSSGFRCHDRHKRLHDLKGAGIGRAPYDEGAVLPACRCHGQGVRHPTPQTACRTPNERRGARTIRRATTSRREAAILDGGRPPHKDRRCVMCFRPADADTAGPRPCPHCGKTVFPADGILPKKCPFCREDLAAGAPSPAAPGAPGAPAPGAPAAPKPPAAPGAPKPPAAPAPAEVTTRPGE